MYKNTNKEQISELKLYIKKWLKFIVRKQIVRYIERMKPKWASLDLETACYTTGNVHTVSIME